MKINVKTFRDQVYACFIGKNIGGTMGTPYEGQRTMQDIKGFVTKENEVLPNDDLDLQLVWFHAVRSLGIRNINSASLGEFWLSFIVPYWNEYGLGKVNMQRGLMPPMSGDYENTWKHSNGAWIRTEIWASLLPGEPDLAAKYAMEDAKVDHGAGEGTVAAAFVAAMQSAAYVVKDLNACIDIALSKIPEESRVAQSVRLVLDCYKKKMTPAETRNAVLKANADIGDGWFEAPSNVAYTVLGLVYGEGDFKKSMITAINCGDDTDCTGATVGATLGILGGMAAIPEDWRAHLGDNIITISINRATLLSFILPNTCTDLTDMVIAETPHTLHDVKASVTLTEGETEIPADVAEKLSEGTVTRDALTHLVPFSFDTDMSFLKVRTIYDGTPDIEANGDRKVTFHFTNNHTVYGNNPYNLRLRWLLPEGFTVSGGKDAVRLPHFDAHDPAMVDVTFTIHAGDKVEPVNRAVLEVIADGRVTPGYVSVVLLG